MIVETLKVEYEQKSQQWFLSNIYFLGHKKRKAASHLKKKQSQHTLIFKYPRAGEGEQQTEERGHTHYENGCKQHK